MDLAKLLIQRGGPGLGGRVLLRVVHLQVPVYEVTLSQPDHFHAREARQHASVDGALGYGRRAASFPLTCAPRSQLPICQETSHVVAHGPSLRVPPTGHILLQLQGYCTSFSEFPLIPDNIWPQDPMPGTQPYGTRDRVTTWQSLLSFFSFPSHLGHLEWRCSRLPPAVGEGPLDYRICVLTKRS